MFVIAGLGNPTGKYENTRHNVGFDVIDLLAENHGIAVKEKKFRACCGSGVIGGERVLLIKPQTFMNASGESISAAMQFYKEEISENLIVICDDINLDVGRLRIRKKGSAGGHNGLKNIIAHLHSEDFMRVRVGVGHKPEGYDLVNFVLGHFPKEEQQIINESEKMAAEAVEMILADGVEKAMNRFNSDKSLLN